MQYFYFQACLLPDSSLSDIKYRFTNLSAVNLDHTSQIKTYQMILTIEPLITLLLYSIRKINFKKSKRSSVSLALVH